MDSTGSHCNRLVWILLDWIGNVARTTGNHSSLKLSGQKTIEIMVSCSGPDHKHLKLEQTPQNNWQERHTAVAHTALKPGAGLLP